MEKLRAEVRRALHELNNRHTGKARRILEDAVA